MQTRIVGIEIGDWSGDGHNHSEKFRVQITGTDVSNKALNVAKDRATAAVGFPLHQIFDGYDDCILSLDQSQALNAAGITHVRYDGILFPSYGVEVDDADPDAEEKRYDNYDAIALVMAYLGYEIEDFAYEVLVEDEPEYVVGRASSVVPSFGYGLLS